MHAMQVLAKVHAMGGHAACSSNRVRSTTHDSAIPHTFHRYIAELAKFRLLPAGSFFSALKQVGPL